MKYQLSALAGLFYGVPGDYFEAVSPEWLNKDVRNIWESAKEQYIQTGHILKSELKTTKNTDIIEAAQISLPANFVAEKLRQTYTEKKVNELLVRFSKTNKGPNEIIEAFLDINSRESRSWSIQSLQSQAIEIWDKGSKNQKYYTYGVSVVDEYMRLKRGNCLFLIAPPKTGKSWQIIHWIVEMCRQGEKVLCLTLEMTAMEIYERIASYISGVDCTLLGTELAPKRYYEEYAKHVEEINELAVEVEECFSMPNSDLYHKYKKAERQGFGVIVLDYIQKIKDPTAKDLRMAMVSTTQSLAELSKKTGITTIAASQAGRSTYGQKQTEVWNAKESSSIEADADLLMTLTDKSEDVFHTPEYKPINLKMVQRKGAEVIIPLNLEKSTGRVYWRKDGEDKSRNDDSNRGDRKPYKESY